MVGFLTAAAIHLVGTIHQPFRGSICSSGIDLTLTHVAFLLLHCIFFYCIYLFILCVVTVFGGIIYHPLMLLFMYGCYYCC